MVNMSVSWFIFPSRKLIMHSKKNGFSGYQIVGVSLEFVPQIPSPNKCWTLDARCKAIFIPRPQTSSASASIHK